MQDSLGVIGNFVAEKAPTYWPIISTILFAVGSSLFRLAQMGLQNLPTKWKWANNKLTVSIMSNIIGRLFGKTTLAYNAKLDIDYTGNTETAKEALKKEIEKHLSRKGGILKEFDRAMETMSNNRIRK